MRIKQSDKPQEKESLTQGISSKTHPAYNAALRGEQRRPPNLNHCAVITKAESNPKCRALGIPLERFVM
ncbi:hypothetical protein [Vibrio parahaemolyticus]|uniref:hypothetical protein n=1 Tax=Vibrio parahaemolyticus TaxID=670 RepID=UPI0007A0752E|nr:hypothetical protein [Vibrio parahaemolyticus]EGQ7741003.1 hypothetical protein [Vibrio parahaemolyticus]EIO3966999.1 hypothetical protein [Vibrio parahaemolyticus]EIO3989861.1 hypothetical protein [Vibrio parahaemolyticus]EJG1399085.1 hypothetical protein [Vibrio parahaemolyticus]ELA9842263.1 hypothetical protein [Vibrio parahaemolyticus]